MYHRFLLERVSSLLRRFPCVLLVGARQVGKTTLVTLDDLAKGRAGFLRVDSHPDLLP